MKYFYFIGNNVRVVIGQPVWRLKNILEIKTGSQNPSQDSLIKAEGRQKKTPEKIKTKKYTKERKSK